MSGSAVAVACLGLLEALSIAKAISQQTRKPLDYNRQCMAEGMANVGGGFSVFTRVRIVDPLGDQLSGRGGDAVVGGHGGGGRGHGGLAFRALAKYIPKASLAGILLVTAAGLVDGRRIRHAVRASRFDAYWCWPRL